MTELKGNWLQRNWRPILMVIIMLILLNNYIIAPYVMLFFPKSALVLELPPALFTLLTIGVGGYVIGRSAEKIKGVDNGK